MTDIVERLRNQVDDGMSIITSDLLEEAADKIEKLRATPPAPHMGVGRRRRGNIDLALAVSRPLKEIDAALSALPVQGTWRTIESAPKDGTDFLAYLGDPPTGDQMVIFYDTPNAEAPTHCWHRADGLAYHQDLPTYWQPLPSPPTPEQARAVSIHKREGE